MRFFGFLLVVALVISCSSAGRKKKANKKQGKRNMAIQAQVSFKQEVVAGPPPPMMMMAAVEAPAAAPSGCSHEGKDLELNDVRMVEDDRCAVARCAQDGQMEKVTFAAASKFYFLEKPQAVPDYPALDLWETGQARTCYSCRCNYGFVVCGPTNSGYC